MTDFLRNRYHPGAAAETFVSRLARRAWGFHLVVGLFLLADLVFVHPGIQFLVMAVIGVAVMAMAFGVALFTRRYLAACGIAASSSQDVRSPYETRMAQRLDRYPWLVSLISLVGWISITVGICWPGETTPGAAEIAVSCLLACLGNVIASGLGQYYWARLSLCSLRLSRLRGPVCGRHLWILIVFSLAVVFTALGVMQIAGFMAGVAHFALMSWAVLLVAWMVSRMISLPLELLAEEIKAFSSGDFSREIKVYPGDETGISASLQAMTAAVRRALQGFSNSADDLTLRMAGMSQNGEYLERALRSRKNQVSETVREMKREKQSAMEVVRVISELSAHLDGASEGQVKLESVLEEGRRRELELENTMAASRHELQSLVQIAGVSHTKISALANAARSARTNLVDSGKILQSLDESAREGIQVAQRLFQETWAGERAVEKCVDGAESLRRVISQAKSRVESLLQRSAQISSVVDFVDDVASRTNLLSLNASIIAAQSGEHGKSFGVVSDHIRELAGQIGSSAQKISEVVAEVRTEIEGASILIRQSHELVCQEVEHTRESGDVLRRIAGEVAYCREVASLTQPVVAAYSENARQTEQFANQAVDVAESFAGAELFSRGSRAIDSLAQTMIPLLQTFGRSCEEQVFASKAQMGCLEEIHRVMALLGQMVTQKERGTAQILERLSQFFDLCEEDSRHAERLSQEAHLATRVLQLLRERLVRQNFLLSAKTHGEVKEDLASSHEASPSLSDEAS